MDSGNVSTCLLPLTSDNAMIHLGGYKGSLTMKSVACVQLGTCVQSVACGKVHNCNLPNESSRDLNWVARMM